MPMRRGTNRSSQHQRPSKVSRRGFLTGGAAAIAAVTVTGPAVLAAQAAPALTPEQLRTLEKFVRDLFPHDRLDDSYYARAIEPLKNEAAQDAQTRRLLTEAIARLDSLSKKSTGKPYVDVTDESARVATIQTMEDTPFFTKVYGDAIVGLYNQPEVWGKFGYEGPSSAKGGYLRRGFNDITWV